MVADGAIDAVADPALFDHLARCPECQGRLAHHDLITLCLEAGRGQALRPTLGAVHLRLPWPLAAAAAMLVALLGAWLWSQAAAGNAHRERLERQVFLVPGSTPRHPCYVVVRGDQIEVIDPLAVDGAQLRDHPALPQQQVNLHRH
jgi:hypothetical protein